MEEGDVSQIADLGVFPSAGHGLGCPENISGLTMSLLFCSFLMLVCLGENRSARMTILASSPFELWIVITLTAFVGGMVDASMACELLSLLSLIHI